jgi:hypothetical protein
MHNKTMLCKPPFSFADDLVILSESQSGLQSALNKLENYCHKWQLTANKNKTKVMIFHTGNTFQSQFCYQKSELTEVQEYTFWAILLIEKEDLRDPRKNFQKRNQRPFSPLKNTCQISSMSLLIYYVNCLIP